MREKTMSLTYACINGESMKQLLGRVDGLLYRAKRAGRNRLVSESLAEVADNTRAHLA